MRNMTFRLPLWIPDGEEGWILSFPSGAFLWFDEDQKTVWGFEKRPLTRGTPPPEG